MISKKTIMQDAKDNDYKPEILEKVFVLLKTLEQFMTIPFLRNQLVLKGGTALNLFYFDTIPRLSVDIDLNYIGQTDKQAMQAERAIINDTISQILQANQFELSRSPAKHAGGKMIWRYPSMMGQMGNLEIDLNYMYRQPLWPVVFKKPHLPFATSVEIPVLDIHELAAGKLSALFSRTVSRDFFDAHHLFSKQPLDIEQLKLAFTIYLSMNSIDLSHLTPERIDFNLADIRNRLLPVLRQKEMPRAPGPLKEWATILRDELREGLARLFPLNPEQIEFITLVRTAGIIRPELITQDKSLSARILAHPLIRWIAQKFQAQ
jgi:predicted nucleotidyltransferase component of viral defense system